MNMRLLPSSASGILSYFTRHGTAANLILVVMLVLGVAASTQIRSQFFPDVVIDNVRCCLCIIPTILIIMRV